MVNKKHGYLIKIIVECAYCQQQSKHYEFPYIEEDVYKGHVMSLTAEFHCPDCGKDFQVPI